MNLSDFGMSGGKRKTLVILGAGASRGASFVKDVTSVLPPLDLDFFQQVSRMSSENDAVRLIEFVRSEYGHEVGLSMEQFFSEADYTDRFHKDMNVDRGRIVRKYGKALDDFMTVLPRLLHQTTSSICEYHGLLAEKLHTQDCIVSFNYDCIMDRALRDRANVRWDPEKKGYAFDIFSGAHIWRNHSRGRHVNRSIRLLKMHGSLNWKANADRTTIRLVRNTSRGFSLKNSIIPPSWFKDLSVFPFAEVWKTARTEIRTSRVMVVIGYSVPQTDLFSRSLFKVEAGSKDKRERLELLVLVNPDNDARRRFLDLVKGGLEPSTKILEYDKLEQLASILKKNI